MDKNGIREKNYPPVNTKEAVFRMHLFCGLNIGTSVLQESEIIESSIEEFTTLHFDLGTGVQGKYIVLIFTMGDGVTEWSVKDLLVWACRYPGEITTTTPSEGSTTTEIRTTTTVPSTTAGSRVTQHCLHDIPLGIVKHMIPRCAISTLLNPQPYCNILDFINLNSSFDMYSNAYTVPDTKKDIGTETDIEPTN